MEICDYGCGREGTFLFKNGKRCCSEKYRSCPTQAANIGKTRLGKKHSEETKRKIGEKSKQRIQERGGSYFKGKKHSEETKRKISNKNKGRKKPEYYAPWNKGSTKHNDDRIASGDQVRHSGTDNGMYGRTHSDDIKEKQRQRNLEEGRWKGEDNPWYGKDRSGKNSPRFLPDQERTEWEKYKHTVRMLTERTYKENINEINPNNYIRGLKEYHLDHIIPLWYGFNNSIDPEKLSKRENLRMLFWSENLKRYKTKLTNEEQLLLEQL